MAICSTALLARLSEHPDDLIHLPLTSPTSVTGITGMSWGLEHIPHVLKYQITLSSLICKGIIVRI